MRAEIATEQAHVDRVYLRLDELRSQAESMRDRGYELGHGARHEAVFEQASMLFERDVMVHHANQTLHVLDAEHEGLVFGRLDTHERETVYVGRLGIRDGEFDNLVTDWRADAAAPFYQATAEQPMGVIRRRVIQSSGRSVTGIEDDVLMPHALPEQMRVVGDGALMAALARARGERMRDIVATIQREQDEVIRAPWRGVTEITGGPGTGKTAVALHRAAYLLYRYRKQIGGGGVLVVGPSEAFTTYISRVLPSMGETSVELRAVGELLDGFEATHTDPAPVATIKGAARMRGVLRRAVRGTPPGVPSELRITYRGEVLRLAGDQLERVRRRVHGRGGQPNRCRVHAAEALLEALADVAQRHAESGGPEVDRTQLVTELGERIEFHRFLVDWWPVLHPEDVLSWLGDEQRLRTAARSQLAPDEISSLAASFADGGAGYSVADIALLDELRALVGKPRRRRVAADDPQQDHQRPPSPGAARSSLPEHYDEFGHVIVDEAQDLSPMQWRMIGRRGRHASWTVVGDPVQSSWYSAADGADADAAEADNVLGSPSARRRFTLRTNYRNSAEIFSLAARVVSGHAGADQLPTAVRATGIDPTVRSVDAASLEYEVQQAALDVLARVEGTVAVIGAMNRVADLEKFLSPVSDKRLTVAGSLDCKGLEYDAVVLVEPAEFLAESMAGRRGLYVAMTRATQRLTVLTSDPDWLPE
nr:UvrD-helicase domain-containing protein [Haloechinothrix aidingensis]